MLSIPSCSFRFTLIIKVVVQILVQMVLRNYPQIKRVYENDFINPSNTVFYAVGPPGHDPGTP
jgi:hypothetical protein